MKVIVFAKSLTTAEQNKAETYLALKYSITLDNQNGGTAGDYTATDGTTVTLGVAATTGDVLECVAYKAFDLANVSAAGADFSVGNDLIVSGNASVVGVTTLASGGGITTTGGDFYVGGDLYVKDDITYDEV